MGFLYEQEQLINWLLPVALTLAIVGSIGVMLVHLLPDLARVYAIGYRHGKQDEAGHEDGHPGRRLGGHLRAVSHEG